MSHASCMLHCYSGTAMVGGSSHIVYLLISTGGGDEWLSGGSLTSERLLQLQLIA